MATELEKLACEVALTAAKERNPHAHNAYVPWRVVVAIREELERLGVDWRAFHKDALRKSEEKP